MTRTHTTFPVAVRAVVIGCILLLGVAAGAAGAAPSKSDVEAAEAKVDALLGDVGSARERLTQIDARLARAAAEVEAANGRLESMTAELLLTRERLDRSRERYERITERLNERAVQAFMNGPASEIEFLLGSSSMDELSDRLEYIDAVAQSDADLAVEVEDLRTQLETDERLLESLRAQAREEQLAAEARKAQVLADLQRQKDLLATVDAKLSEAERYSKKVSKAYKAALVAAAAQGYGGGHDAVAMPDGWQHVIEVCPVAAPRSYWDGFGAPRYAGGYHLHKGNDILAPAGTPIYAPFDGVARSDHNSLGGNVVFVEGAYGRVYNAHLSSFSDRSNGPVVAGDVIGYVGDTGDATGIPHDHFEFHPWVMPSSWPASSYGYSIIEDAINPYPLLVAACG